MIWSGSVLEKSVLRLRSLKIRSYISFPRRSLCRWVPGISLTMIGRLLQWAIWSYLQNTKYSKKWQDWFGNPSTRVCKWGYKQGWIPRDLPRDPWLDFLMIQSDKGCRYWQPMWLQNWAYFGDGLLYATYLRWKYTSCSQMISIIYPLALAHLTTHFWEVKRVGNTILSLILRCEMVPWAKKEYYWSKIKHFLDE